MKQLVTSDTGGFPFTLDRLRWMQDGFTEAISMLSTIYGDNYIISGCELTVTTTSNMATLTPGIGVLDGEVCEVQGTSISHPKNNTLYVEIEQNYDSSGTVLFQNGQQKDIHAIRRIVLKSTNAPQGGEVLFNSLVRPLEAERANISELQTKMTAIESQWIDHAPTLKEWTGGTSQVIRYKIIGKTCFLHLYLEAVNTTVGGAWINMSLPFAARNKQYYKAYNGAVGTQSTLFIDGANLSIRKHTGSYTVGETFTVGITLTIEI